MKDDLDRYIDRRFGESGKEREAYDKGSQEFLRKTTGDEPRLKQIEVDAELQEKMDAVGKSWRNTKEARSNSESISVPD